MVRVASSETSDVIRRHSALLLVLLLGTGSLAGCFEDGADSGDGADSPEFPEGHDPARLVIDDGSPLIYYSGIEVILHEDGGWRELSSEFCGGDWCILRDEEEPVWIEERLGEGVDGPLEVGAAPGMHGPRVIYYTITDWVADAGAACIGRAVNHGTATAPEWVDDGTPVICSTEESVEAGDAFAIDAAVFETPAGGLWMVYGSHWSGIWIVELNATTGHLAEHAGDGWSEGDVHSDENPNGSYHHVAVGPERAQPGDEDGFLGGSIEAAYVHEREGKYYLFVNWYSCCMGVDSEYEIRVGVSDSPIGPFIDRSGTPMLDGGGTLVLGSEGRFIGPGHAGIHTLASGIDVFSFHFYDGESDGVGSIAIRELDWDAEGWPVVTGRVPDL